MAYVNEQAGYPRALNPIDRTIAYGPGFNYVAGNEQGLYARQDLDPDFLPTTEARLIRSPGEVGLYDWQLWGQDSWKELHGTFQAADRFRKKLQEEYGELVAEIVGDEQSRDKILSEVGDVGWCALALASNGSANIDHGVKNYLYEAVMGIRWIDHQGQYQDPVWRPRAAELCTTNNRQLTAADIDGLVAEGFVAEASNAMNIFDIPDEDFDEDPRADHYVRAMIGDIIVLASLAEQQYGFGDREIASCGEPHGWVGQMSYQALSKEVQVLSAKILFQLALVARKSCGGSLTEAIQINTAKIKSRVEENLIDKTDGERPDELQ